MHMSGMSMASIILNTNVGFTTLGKCKGHIARDIKFALKCRIDNKTFVRNLWNLVQITENYEVQHNLCLFSINEYYYEDFF